MITAFFSCKKDEDMSTVVSVPKIELIGTAVYSTATGPGTYTDPGAILTDEDGNTSTLTTPTEGTVNLGTAGFYSVKYQVKTKYGYTVSAARLVLVTGVSPALDYSGMYYRTLNGQEVNITKLGTGLYKTDNVGGVADDPAFIYDVYFGQVDDSVLVVPDQPNALGGELYGTDSKVTVSGADTIIQWKVIGSGYGTSLRVFVK